MRNNDNETCEKRLKKPCIEVTESEKNALLYNAVLIEIDRLEKTKDKKERAAIRAFILEGYSRLMKKRNFI